jgi:hypothetical protein
MASSQVRSGNPHPDRPGGITLGWDRTSNKLPARPHRYPKSVAGMAYLPVSLRDEESLAP